MRLFIFLCLSILSTTLHAHAGSMPSSTPNASSSYAAKTYALRNDLYGAKWKSSVKQVTDHAEQFDPSVLLDLSQSLKTHGQPENALFWYFVARMRGTHDVICTQSPQMMSTLGMMFEQAQQSLEVFIRRHPMQAKDALHKAKEWNASHAWTYPSNWLSFGPATSCASQIKVDVQETVVEHMTMMIDQPIK